MRELSTIDLVSRIIEIALGEPYGDGDIITDVVTDYAEPGYRTSNGVIVLGNFNDKRPTYGWQVRQLDGTPYRTQPPLAKWMTIPSRLARVLEAAGADLEWSDEWVRCGDCGRIFRTQPNSYSWTMNGAYSEDGCDYYCADCLVSDPESLIEEYVNDATRALTFDVDLSALGFEQENGTYENGWHPGQEDNPTEILARILKFAPEGTEVVFTIAEQSQFYLKFQAWVRTPESSDDDI